VLSKAHAAEAIMQYYQKIGLRGKEMLDKYYAYKSQSSRSCRPVGVRPVIDYFQAVITDQGCHCCRVGSEGRKN